MRDSLSGFTPIWKPKESDMSRYLTDGDSETYRGFTVNVWHDPDTEMPYDCDDAVIISILHRRYIDPSKGRCGSTPDAVMQWAREHAADWLGVPLWLYDHSGTIYRTGTSNPFHCPWDSGMAGFIFLKRSEWGNGNEPVAKLQEYAANVAAEYSAWANGQCYWYEITDSDGNDIGESCGGFVGMDADTSGLWEMATNAIDCHIAWSAKQERAARIDTVKTMIRNRVPILKRPAMLANALA